MEDSIEIKLDEQHTQIRQWARDFAEREIKPIAERIDRTDEYPRELTRKMGEYGLLGLNLPQEYGGLGLDMLSSVIVGEEISKASLSAGFILGVHNGLIGNLLAKFGSKEQKEKYLPKLIRGELIGSYGLTEPNAGSDAASVSTTAVKEGSYYRVNGTKIWITQGAVCDVLAFFARTGKKEDKAAGISAFIVEKGTDGFMVGQRLEVMGARGTGTAELIFSNMLIPASNLIGSEGDGFLMAMSILEESRIGAAAAAVGIAEAAFEAAFSYSKKRVVFDRPLSSFESVRFLIADMATRIRAAKLLTYNAAYLHSKGMEFRKEASMAKYYASETAVWVCERAIQLHGGYGVSKLLPLERYFRDAKILDIVEGTSEVQRYILSRELFSS